MPKTANKPIIAVDIDDVLSNLAEELVNTSNKMWGTNLTVEDYNEHWGEMWKVDEEENIKRSAEIHKINLPSKLKHNTSAVPVLKNLSKKYKLILATSRRRTISQETKDWIDKYFEGIFSEIHFAGIWDSDDHTEHKVQATKADLLQQIGANFLIDDQAKHCFAAAEQGITAVLFGNYPWNRGIELPEGVSRAKNWQEVLEYFDAQDR